MLGHIESAFVEFLESAVLFCITEDVLRTVGRIVHEFVHDHHVVISGLDEVGRSRVALPSEAAVVLYTCVVAALSGLCGDEHDSGRCLRTIDGTS